MLERCLHAKVCAACKSAFQAAWESHRRAGSAMLSYHCYMLSLTSVAATSAAEPSSTLLPNTLIYRMCYKHYV